MIKVFEQGTFHTTSRIRLDEARMSISPPSYYQQIGKTTVFISHKHDDLDDLNGILELFRTQYDVMAYIDSQDPSMPKVTSPETASNIKNRIKQCEKFILLATNGAIESKWCNWELGYGDSIRFKDHIALLPIKPKNSADNYYKGSEYMGLYPHIVFFEHAEILNGNYIPSGRYVQYPESEGARLVPLKNWFLNK